jgi:hypothetical protein
VQSGFDKKRMDWCRSYVEARTVKKKEKIIAKLAFDALLRNCI